MSSMSSIASQNSSAIERSHSDAVFNLRVALVISAVGEFCLALYIHFVGAEEDMAAVFCQTLFGKALDLRYHVAALLL